MGTLCVRSVFFYFKLVVVVPTNKVWCNEQYVREAINLAYIFMVYTHMLPMYTQIVVCANCLRIFHRKEQSCCEM